MIPERTIIDVVQRDRRAARPTQVAEPPGARSVSACEQVGPVCRLGADVAARAERVQQAWIWPSHASTRGRSAVWSI